MFHPRPATVDMLRAQSMKIDDLQREMAGLRQDVRRLLLLLEQMAPGVPGAQCAGGGPTGSDSDLRLDT